MRPLSNLSSADRLADRQARKHSTKRKRKAKKKPSWTATLFTATQAERSAAAERKEKAPRRGSFWVGAPREGFTSTAARALAVQTSDGMVRPR